MVGGAIKGGPVGMTRGTIGGAVIGQCLSGGGNGTEAETELVPVIVQEVTSVVPVVDK